MIDFCVGVSGCVSEVHILESTAADEVQVVLSFSCNQCAKADQLCAPRVRA